MGALDYNLARMKGIDDKIGQMSSQAFQGKEASKGGFFGSLQNLIATINRGRELEKDRGFRAGETEKERQAGIEAAGLLSGERGDIRAAEILKYKDGYYYDSLTDKHYEWDDEPTFELIKSQMDRDRDRYFEVNFGSGAKSREPKNLSEKFLEKLGMLGSSTFKESFDSNALRFTWDWTDENKDKLRKAFGNTLTEFSTSERFALNNMLEDYMNQRSFDTPKEEGAEGGSFWDWIQGRGGEGDPTGGYTMGSYGDIPGLTPTVPKKSELAKQLDTAGVDPESYRPSNIPSSIPSASTSIDSSTKEKILRLLEEGPSPTTRADRQELSAYMSDMEAGDMNESALNRFLRFLESIK